ncbi:hypothetical protein OFN49_32775, partial [Escherichia coli]|nr:hypothetical protein [Escherichia coli]
IISANLMRSTHLAPNLPTQRYTIGQNSPDRAIGDKSVYYFIPNVDFVDHFARFSSHFRHI